MKTFLYLGLTAVAFAGLCPAETPFVQHNLVSDIDGMADRTDPCLINPWGITASPTSPFWLSANHSGLSTVYDAKGIILPLIVQVPGPGGLVAATGQCAKSTFGAGAPTGIVFNDTASFVLSGTPASFIFATEQGVIAAWNGAQGAVAKLLTDQSNSGAIYKGLAIATRSEGPLLYAADFANGRIDVFDGSMNKVTLEGAFADPQIPAAFAPFNIQNLGGSLYVTYALPDAEHEDDKAGPGNGYVDVFDLNGVLLKHLVANGPLNSPWGLAIAPDTFGDFAGTLLVGNFGDGTINAFDTETGKSLGALQDAAGTNIRIPGLWGLMFGNGDAANTLYFTAGIPGPDDVESHGLFGTIVRQPLPATRMPKRTQAVPVLIWL